VGDPPPHRTGWRIDTPAGGREFARRASNLVNAALATSGPGAQHAVVDGIRYSHIIDPRSGFAVTSELTARVIAPDAAIADALATTMCVAGEASPSLLARFPGVVVDLAR
jgi:thiamine biosynthesis lipoprotein